MPHPAPRDSAAYLVVDDVRVVFNTGTPSEVRALDGCSFSLRDGELAFLVGPNGCGKTTLLRALVSGRVDSGRLQLGGRRLDGLPAHRIAPLVSRVAQDASESLVPDLTVEEHLSLAELRGTRGRLRCALSPPRRARARERLALLDMGLEDRLADCAANLSGGQRQALALAMALLDPPPSLLLLDEPTAATDPRVTDLIERIAVRAVREQGVTTVWVTHRHAQAVRFADRLIVLRGGRVAHDLRRPQFDGMTETDVAALLVALPDAGPRPGATADAMA